MIGDSQRFGIPSIFRLWGELLVSGSWSARRHKLVPERSGSTAHCMKTLYALLWSYVGVEGVGGRKDSKTEVKIPSGL